MSTPITRNYLNLTEILSQAYLNKYTILFLLILVKLIIFKNSLISQLNQTIVNETICNKDQIEPILSSIHNIILDGLKETQHAGITFIVIIVTIIKNLLIFYIEIFVGTFLCLLNAVIKGTTELALDSSETIIRAVNTTVVEVTNQVEEGLKGLSGVLNDFAKGAMGFKSIFSGKASNPSEFEDRIHLSLGELKDKIAIPSEVVDAINSVRNADLGKLTKLDNATQVILEAPFKLVTKQLKEFKDKKNYSETVKPIDANQIQQLCNAHVESVHNVQKGLIIVVENLTKTLVILLIMAMIGSTCYVVFIECMKWRRMQKFIREDLSHPVKFKNQYNIYHSSSMYMVAKRFNLRVGDRALWWWSFLSSKFAGYTLLFGIMGLMALLCQYIIISKLRHTLGERATELMQDEQSRNLTTTYIKDMKQYINNTESSVNKELFGHFHKATGAVHKELTEFIEIMNSTMTDIFGKIPLGKPINTVIYCVLGRKLVALERGIDWLHQNIRIKLPRLSKNLENDIKQLKFVKTSSVLNKLNTMIDVYEKSLRLELYISTVLVALWGLQIIIGSIWVFLQDRKVTQELVMISSPQPLSKSEKILYGYPLDNPHISFPGAFIPSRSSSIPSPLSKYNKT
ncbi:uncharacterized protein SPAPADRAFT_53463 [Spathaspora passalidarum NRRL Y-27907]|uniref:Plasma membrane fusion protein PRM1 n=1 Tax=Spathaspora passalidarum (strain NRRL Y-27907 / 11-Y1) TaxID=619300 RepID=G3AFY4_SPAPN|nr:uncharacterized protein SPAPADRAFT_53463 [Spathaspora passalidarum NRRL Y-27907]EGW35123.1 hypothetical protein SPAPADRAFT_53463 [Spathaspora passalidarum NRRL Y-27907]